MTTRRAQMAIDADSGKTDDFLTPREELSVVMGVYIQSVAAFKRKKPVGLERDHLVEALGAAEHHLLKMLLRLHGDEWYDEVERLTQELSDGS